MEPQVTPCLTRQLCLIRLLPVPIPGAILLLGSGLMGLLGIGRSKKKERLV